IELKTRFILYKMMYNKKYNQQSRMGEVYPMARVLSISEAREQINAIAEDAEEITVTKYGKPVLTILPYELYESMVETMEIMADAEAMAVLRQYKDDLENGRPIETYSLEEVAEELGIELLSHKAR